MASDSLPVTDVAPASARETKYDIPGISSEDLARLSKQLGVDPEVFERGSSYVKSSLMTDATAKALHTLDEAVILDSLGNRMRSYLAKMNPTQAENFDGASHALDLFESSRLEAIGSQIRFSADEGNLKVFIPSGYFPDLSDDEIKSILVETAERMTQDNLWRITQTVAKGTENLNPLAQPIGLSAIWGLRDVLDSRFKLEEVGQWTDGLPEGYEPNKMQLELYEARKLFPKTLERTSGFFTGPLATAQWSPTTGPRRPKNIVLTVDLPPATSDTVNAVKAHRNQFFQTELDSLEAYNNARVRAGAAIPTSSRTYELITLQRDPGEELIKGFDLALESGEGGDGDLLPAFASYYNPVEPQGLSKDLGIFVTMDSERMSTVRDLKQTGSKRPLVNPRTTELIVYDSGSHRSWTRYFARKAGRYQQVYEGYRATKTRENDLPAPVLLDPNYTHPDDHSDRSFASDTES